jgi:ketosteroid isomerase-like protein
MILTGLALIGVAAMATTASGPSESEQLITNEKAWAKAGLDGDADRMASLMADEYVELAWEPATQTAPAHWIAVGKKEWVADVRRHTEVYTSVEVHNLTVHMQGILAVVTGEYSQTGTNNGKDISASGIYADTWIKRSGRWLLVHSVFP